MTKRKTRLPPRLTEEVVHNALAVTDKNKKVPKHVAKRHAMSDLSKRYKDRVALYMKDKYELEFLNNLSKEERDALRFMAYKEMDMKEKAGLLGAKYLNGASKGGSAMHTYDALPPEGNHDIQSACATLTKKTKEYKASVNYTVAVKQSITQVFNNLGGIEGYTQWAMENKTKFYEHWVKLLPLEVKATMSADDKVLDALNNARRRTGVTIDQTAEELKDGIENTQRAVIEALSTFHEE